MAKLGDVAKYIRSKSAGPFWVTIDIFCKDAVSFDRIARSPALAPRSIASLFGVSENAVRQFRLAGINVFKLSFPRSVVQGAPHDVDSHAGQYFVPLLSVEIE